MASPNVGCFLRLGKGFFAERATSISLHFSRHFAARFRGFLREGIFLYRDEKKTDSKTRQELVIIVHEGLIVREYGHLAGPPNSFKKNSSPSAFPKKMIRFLLSEQQMK